MIQPAPVALDPVLTTNERLAAIRAAFEEDRTQMTLMLARKLSVPKVDVIRAFEALGKVHVIVSNGVATIEAYDQFGKFSIADGFFNIRSDSLDMHIRSWELASIIAVGKQSDVDWKETISFQFFDRRGNAAFKVFLRFGGQDPSAELMAKYEQLINDLWAK